MLVPIALVVGGALLATIWFLLGHRRHTPHLHLDFDSLRPIDEGLPALAGLTGGAVADGNEVRVLQDGALFDAMADDIEAARHAVHLETFVWTPGQVEERFTELLARRARDGLRVRVLLDAMGGGDASGSALRRMREAGAEVALYSRPRWRNLRRLNHRTHRKLLLVDGAIGYTFGHGIADQWLGEGEDEHHWRDTAVRIAGPGVLAMQAVFMENWIEETHRVPTGDGCFPQVEVCGATPVHVVSSASGDAVSAVALLYTVAIASAREEVVIQNPYFAPDDGVCKLLAIMVGRGVAVHLMVPGKCTDSPFVRRAGCALYRQLLESGVRLYEFEATLLHQKIVIVDRVWSHVGSTNFDSRSLALNEEAGIGIVDREVASELRAAFERDLGRSREITLDEWRRRPLAARAVDRFAYILHDQM